MVFRCIVVFSFCVLLRKHKGAERRMQPTADYCRRYAIQYISIGEMAGFDVITYWTLATFLSSVLYIFFQKNILINMKRFQHKTKSVSRVLITFGDELNFSRCMILWSSILLKRTVYITPFSGNIASCGWMTDKVKLGHGHVGGQLDRVQWTVAPNIDNVLYRVGNYI